jgi:hypothetical protein
MKRFSILFATGALALGLAGGCATTVPAPAPLGSADLAPSVRNAPADVARGNRPLDGRAATVRNPRPEVARGNASDDAQANRVTSSSDPEVARGNRQAAAWGVTLAAR